MMGENIWSSEEDEEEEDAVVPELVSMDGEEEEEEEEEVTFLPVDRRLYQAVHDFLEVGHTSIFKIDHS